MNDKPWEELDAARARIKALESTQDSWRHLVETANAQRKDVEADHADNVARYEREPGCPDAPPPAGDKRCSCGRRAEVESYGHFEGCPARRSK